MPWKIRWRRIQTQFNKWKKLMLKASTNILCYNIYTILGCDIVQRYGDNCFSWQLQLSTRLSFFYEFNDFVSSTCRTQEMPNQTKVEFFNALLRWGGILKFSVTQQSFRNRDCINYLKGNLCQENKK